MGQLGDGTTTNRSTPTQIGTDTDWSRVDSFESNNLAVKTDGSLWAWGNNFNGQNGNGNHGAGAMDLIPTRVGLENDWASTAGTSFAIKNNGTLWGWGSNGSGRLGTGDFEDHFTPVQIGIDSDWVAVSGASNQTLALKNNGTLWGWGLNKNGSLAIGAVNNFVLVPTQTGNGTADWQKIDVGGCCSSKMIKTDGTLWAMGIGSQGNLGNGTTVDSNMPVQVGFANNWVVASNTNSTCALQSEGSLWTWGNNFAGQLGNGNSINGTTPQQIGSIVWQQVVTGFNYAIGLSSAGTLYSWGWNNNGQLGDGTFVDKNVPTQVGETCNLTAKEFRLKDSFTVAPNPTIDIARVNFFLNDYVATTLVLTTITAQKVFEHKIIGTIGQNNYPIDISTYAPGIYLLTLKTANESVTVKVIKQ